MTAEATFWRQAAESFGVRLTRLGVQVPIHEWCVSVLFHSGRGVTKPWPEWGMLLLFCASLPHISKNILVVRTPTLNLVGRTRVHGATDYALG